MDPDGPGAAPLGLAESGAILLYLAEKTGQLLPVHPVLRMEAIQWVFFQAAGRDYADKRPFGRKRHGCSAC